MRQRGTLLKPFVTAVFCALVIVGMLKWTKFDYDLTAAFVGPNKASERVLIEFQEENNVDEFLMVRLSKLDGPKLDEKTKSEFISDSKALGLELDLAPQEGVEHKVGSRDIGAMYMLAQEVQAVTVGSQVARSFFEEFLRPTPNLQTLSKDPFGFEKSARGFLASKLHFAEDPSKEDLSLRNVSPASSPQRWIYFEKWKEKVSMYGDFLKSDATHWVVSRDTFVSVTASLILIGILTIFYLRDFRFLAMVLTSFAAGCAAMLLGLKLFFGQVFPVFFPLMTIGLVISVSFMTFLSGLEGLRRKGNIRSLFLLIFVLVLLSGSLLFSSSKFIVQIGLSFLFYCLGSLAVGTVFSDQFKKFYFPKTATKGAGRVKYKRILLPLTSILIVLSLVWIYRGFPQMKAESSEIVFMPESLKEMRQTILGNAHEGSIGVVFEKKGLGSVLIGQDLLLFEKLTAIAGQTTLISGFLKGVIDSFTKSLNSLGVSLNPNLIAANEVSPESSASSEDLLKFVCRGFGFTCLSQHPEWLGARITRDQISQIKSSGHSVLQIGEEGRLEEVVKEAGLGLLYISLAVVSLILILTFLFQANLFLSLISIFIVGLSSAIWVTLVGRLTLPFILGILWSGTIMFFSLANYLKPSCQDEDQSKSEFVQASLIISSICLILAKHPFVFQFGCAALFVSLCSKFMAMFLVTRARGSSRASLY